MTYAQVIPNPITYVGADPTGNGCGGTQIDLLTTTGGIYTCQAGVFGLNPAGAASSVPYTGITGVPANSILGNNTGGVANAVAIGTTGTGSVVLATSPTFVTGISSPAITDSALTSGRVTFAGTGGLLSDASTLTYNGLNVLGLGPSNLVMEYDSGNSRALVGSVVGYSLDFITGNVRQWEIDTSGNLATVGAGKNLTVSGTLGVTGLSTQSGIMSGGTKFTTSGCSVSSTTGGAAAGTFTVGANTCTVIITINGATGLTATNGWNCHGEDQTALLVLISQSASSTTTCSLSIPATAGATDVIRFTAMAY